MLVQKCLKGYIYSLYFALKILQYNFFVMRNFNAILLVLKHSFGIYLLDSNGILLECFKVFMRLDKFLGFFSEIFEFLSCYFLSQNSERII